MRGIDESSPHVYGMFGRVEQRVRTPTLDRTAGVHHQDVVGHLGDHAQVVRDDDDRGAELLLQAASSSRICACTVTSSAVVGSSAMISAGSLTSAIAIIARCRMPPENSCGYWSIRLARLRDADPLEHLDGALARAASFGTSWCTRYASTIWLPTV